MFFADAHADSLLWNRDLSKRSDQGHVDFPRLLEAGVRLQCFTVVTRGFPWVGGFPLFAAWRKWPAAARRGEWARALWQVNRLYEYSARSDGRVAVTTTRRQLDDNLSSNVLSAILGIEGAHALEGHLERVGELFERGVRFMSLQHLSNNELGGSSHPLMGNKPLTPLGRAVLDEMARLGMAMDVAHSSAKATAEILSHRVLPFCSHTGVRAQGGGGRNLGDDSLRRIAERGGVVGIIFGTVYLGGTGLKDWVRHVDHALKLMGEDGVALGSDFDGMVPLPRGMRDVRDLKQVHAALEKKFPARVVEKILGGNLVRFFQGLLPPGSGHSKY